jgi:hypothetical protein
VDNAARAELDSATATIEELVRRISAAADQQQTDGDEAAAGDLYDVERALRAAARRLANVVRRLES